MNGLGRTSVDPDIYVTYPDISINSCWESFNVCTLGRISKSKVTYIETVGSPRPQCFVNHNISYDTLVGYDPALSYVCNSQASLTTWNVMCDDETIAQYNDWDNPPYEECKGHDCEIGEYLNADGVCVADELKQPGIMQCPLTLEGNPINPLNGEKFRSTPIYTLLMRVVYHSLAIIPVLDHH